MKSKKQHVEEWLPVLPKFNEEQIRKLYFLMEDYAKDYHKCKVNELRIGGVIKSVCCGELIKETSLQWYCSKCDKTIEFK
jgi:hypothetical protein